MRGTAIKETNPYLCCSILEDVAGCCLATFFHYQKLCQIPRHKFLILGWTQVWISYVVTNKESETENEVFVIWPKFSWKWNWISRKLSWKFKLRLNSTIHLIKIQHLQVKFKLLLSILLKINHILPNTYYFQLQVLQSCTSVNPDWCVFFTRSKLFIGEIWHLFCVKKQKSLDKQLQRRMIAEPIFDRT